MRETEGRADSAGVAESTAVIDALVANHRRFLAFLERRVGSRAVAEDLLQEAFVRGMDRASSLRRAESATAWFYRLLRNALTDHFRRQQAEGRALAAAALETPESSEAVDEELHRVLCACIGDLVDTLRPEYASAIRRVELEGVSVRHFADEVGITPNNAAVRLHRARQSLRRQVERSCGTCAVHGCEDCTCQSWLVPVDPATPIKPAPATDPRSPDPNDAAGRGRRTRPAPERRR